MTQAYDTSTGHNETLRATDRALHVTSPFVTINQSTLTAQQTAGFAASGYTAPTTFFVTNPTTGPHWQIWEGDDDDLVYDQRFTDGAAHVRLCCIRSCR